MNKPKPQAKADFAVLYTDREQGLLTIDCHHNLISLFAEFGVMQFKGDPVHGPIRFGPRSDHLRFVLSVSSIYDQGEVIDYIHGLAADDRRRTKEVAEACDIWREPDTQPAPDFDVAQAIQGALWKGHVNNGDWGTDDDDPGESPIFEH